MKTTTLNEIIELCEKESIDLWYFSQIKKFEYLNPMSSFVSDQ